MFNYKWKIQDGYPAQGVERHSLKVFSTFACGGGSTMGYKLAGYDVIGANDIDPQMAKVYQANHKPKHYFLCPIGDLLTKDLPEELYNLDILDGSPPCSTFSMAGSREDAWKKKKKFREGQADQILSDLFFDWIALVERLKPKVAIAENVKGMLLGNAKAYTKAIVERLNEVGYEVQLFLVNGASMGIPQRRERIFFICKRKDLNLPKMSIDFNYKPVIFSEFQENTNSGSKKVSDAEKELWSKRKIGDADLGVITKRLVGKESRFTTKLQYNHKIPLTITAGDNTILFSTCRKFTDYELSCIGSWPLDYDFMDIDNRYLIGMSVPPVMTANIAYQVYLQLFKNAKI